MSKPVKAVFDAESNPDLMDSDIHEKARLSGLSVKEYKEALAELNNSPTGLLMLTLAQLERDFLQNWRRRMDSALKLAEEAKDYKAIAMIEKEKQLTVERLIKSGRMISPFEAEKSEAKKDDEEEELVLGILPNEHPSEYWESLKKDKAG